MNSVFCFGSNWAGRHGAGAALTAATYHGAIEGQGEGLQGSSYAIPTMDRHIQTLPLMLIEQNVNRFLLFANMNPNMGFQITRIGCGQAGYTNEQIAPMFQLAPPQNCFFDTKWRPILGETFEYWGTVG
jgi:hypothetical protein